MNRKKIRNFVQSPKYKSRIDVRAPDAILHTVGSSGKNKGQYHLSKTNRPWVVLHEAN